MNSTDLGELRLLPYQLLAMRQDAAAIRDDDLDDDEADHYTLAHIAQLLKLRREQETPRAKVIKLHGVSYQTLRILTAIQDLIEDTKIALDTNLDANCDPTEREHERLQIQEFMSYLLTKIDKVAGFKKKYSVVRNAGKWLTWNTIHRVLNRIVQKKVELAAHAPLVKLHLWVGAAKAAWQPKLMNVV